MDKVSPLVQLDYGPPGTLFERPRLWRLAIGLSLSAGAAAITWREVSLEHDLRQHLVLHLEPPLAVGRNRLKLVVCDDLNAGRCEALMAQLPTGVVAPSWLAATRSRRQDNAARST